jgi:dTDP-4-amino-4,6-dideoxygalactose transaminase
LRSHGISSDQSDMQLRPVDEIWNYQQLQLGFNYRMTEMQAALGLSQLKQLDAFVLKRHALATVYDKALQDLSLITPWQHPDSYSSYHLYAVLIPKTKDGPSQRQVYRAMHEAGIHVNLHYIPVYLQPFYAAMGFKRGYCPKAESYFKQAISLPLHTGLTPEQQLFVNSQVMRLLKTEKQTTVVHA